MRASPWPPIGIAVCLLATARPAGAGVPSATSCVACHGDVSPAVVEAARKDVHGEVGLSCHDCHGGNPDPALASDASAAMDPAHAENPYVGVPGPAEIPATCGRCHADPVFMKRYAADPRVDQVSEYWTSGHGHALRRGDTRVAQCASCHGAHGVRRTDDPDATVYPTRVAGTCARCHAGPEAGWRRSVHADALLAGGQLSAPTCNDCHGDHGATPPGVESLSRVCGHCHTRQAEMFRASPKAAGFRRHREHLAEAGPGRCAVCHETGKAAPETEHLAPFTECASCHGAHTVARPTVAMLGPLPATPCDFCHDAEDRGGPLAGERAHFRELKARLLAEAGGRQGDELFDWMVARTLVLPTHTDRVEQADGPPRHVLKPGVAALFGELRLGTTAGLTAASRSVDRAMRGGECAAVSRPEPAPPAPPAGASSAPPAAPTKIRSTVSIGAITRCTSCHEAEPRLGEPRGWRVSEEYLEGIRELSRVTAEAQRVVLKAERSGVLATEAKVEIQHATDALVQLRVLVHTFSTGEGSPFAAKQREGLEHAQNALRAGQAALDELAFRRRGLAASLVIVVVVVIALGLKIRQLSPRGRT